jgi:two-component system cell cycle sensor histidine kinase/response regulator CckA
MAAGVVPPDGGASKTAQPTIIVADDDPIVLRLVGGFLLQRGYRVLEAAGGIEALDLADRQNGALDLLVTDVQMPDLDGCTLWARLKERHPAVPAIFMSGFSDMDSPADASFVSKPFKLNDLERIVHEVLNGAHSTRKAGPANGRHRGGDAGKP